MCWWGSLKVQRVSSGLTNWLWLSYYLSIPIPHFNVDNLIPNSAVVRVPWKRPLIDCFPCDPLHIQIFTVGVPWSRTYFCLHGPHIESMESNGYWNIPSWIEDFVFPDIALYCLSCLTLDYVSLSRHKSGTRAEFSTAGNTYMPCHGFHLRTLHDLR